jgi:hypothetical protein
METAIITITNTLDVLRNQIVQLEEQLTVVREEIASDAAMYPYEMLAEAMFEENKDVDVCDLMTLLMIAEIDVHVMNQAAGTYSDYRCPGLLALFDGHLGELDEHVKIMLATLN